jgi:MATE family multidrug resistance protein
MERLMVTFGQDAALSKDASWFLMLNAPSLFFMASSETLKRYFVCQSLVIPPTVAALCSVVVTVGFNHVFLRLMGLGLKGAALAANLSQLSPLVILIVWLSMREKRLHRMDSMEATWFGFSMEALYGWKEYILLAIPSAAMVALEWSIFEICLFMSGWLEDPELHVAIMGLSLNVSGTLYMLPSGIAFAGATRVGNAIGAKLAHHARRSAWTCVGLTTICQLLIGSLVVLGRDHVASIFSNDAQVLQGTAQIMPLVCWCMFGDGLNASVGGAFRGLGKQKLGAIFNLVAYWILGLPLAYSLAFKADLGLVGLWIGLSTCAMLNGLVMVSALRFKIDWKECVESATSRLANDPTVD